MKPWFAGPAVSFTYLFHFHLIQFGAPFSLDGSPYFIIMSIIIEGFVLEKLN